MLNILKRLPRRKLLNYQFYSVSVQSEEKIEIPVRIPRGPTDILRALESTVSRDPTAAHYKYHDDPFLIPTSNSGKRTFALAQESGRKAAHWVRKQHPNLFQHREAEPYIQAYAPPMVYNEDSQVTDDDLRKLVETAQVTDAIFVYKKLKQSGASIDNDLEIALLELLCYQNCEDGLNEEFIEERWFRQQHRSKEKTRKTWKDGDFAEEVFISIKDKPERAYAAIIQGMSKYRQSDRAWQLFEEAKEKKYLLNTNTYNALLSIVNFLKESNELRWELITTLLIEMKNKQLRPNLGTLNSILYALVGSGNQKMAKQNALKVLSEFKKLEIEPSLASWSFIIRIFCKERGPISTILHEILNILQGKEHQIRDIQDTNFFLTAMENCRYHLKDVDLAKRVNELLNYGNNYNLIGDSYKESIYYRHYFALYCESIPLDDFMNQVYNVLVPHLYVPEPGIMSEVLKHIDANGAVKYFPKIWSDMIIFDHHYRENLVEQLLRGMVNNLELVENELVEQFAYVAWDVYKRIDEQDQDKMFRINFTGEVLGNIMIILLKAKKFKEACVIFERLEKNQNNIVGIPTIESLIHFIEQCIEEKAPTRAIDCIQYCTDCGFPEAKTLAKSLHEKLNLDEVYLSRLKKIVSDF